MFNFYQYKNENYYSKTIILFILFVHFCSRCKKRPREKAYEKYEKGEKLSKLEKRLVSLYKINIKTRHTEGLLDKMCELQSNIDRQIEEISNDIKKGNLGGMKNKMLLVDQNFNEMSQVNEEIKEGNLFQYMFS